MVALPSSPPATARLFDRSSPAVGHSVGAGADDSVGSVAVRLGVVVARARQPEARDEAESDARRPLHGGGP